MDCETKALQLVSVLQAIDRGSVRELRLRGDVLEACTTVRCRHCGEALSTRIHFEDVRLLGLGDWD